MSQVFKEYMPWATVRLDDRDSRRSFARRSAASHVHFDDDTDDQGAPTLSHNNCFLLYVENNRLGMLKP